MCSFTIHAQSKFTIIFNAVIEERLALKCSGYAASKKQVPRLRGSTVSRPILFARDDRITGSLQRHALKARPFKASRLFVCLSTVHFFDLQPALTIVGARISRRDRQRKSDPLQAYLRIFNGDRCGTKALPTSKDEAKISRRLLLEIKPSHWICLRRLDVAKVSAVSPL